MSVVCEKLPPKLSAAVRLAVLDLELVEQDPRYRVDMAVFHNGPNEEIGTTQCHVCFAGAVMAKTCEVPIGLRLEDSEDMGYFDEATLQKFYALDSVRVGNVAGAVAQYEGIESEAVPRGLRRTFGFPTQYSTDPTLFKRRMLELADILEQEGK